MMSPRAQALAERLATLNQEIIAFAEHCPEAAWTRVTEGEGWPVNVLLCHIANGYDAGTGFLKKVIEGGPLPTITVDMIHHGNAQNVEKYAQTTKAEVTSRLKERGAAAVGVLEQLNDTLLDTAVEGFVQKMPCQQIAELTIGHTGGHFASAQAAVGVK